jgi:hypothetical protein
MMKEYEIIPWLNKNKVLVCFFQQGCSMCLEVEPLAELLEGRGPEIVKISCDDSDNLLYEFGGEGTPYWCYFEKGKMVKSIVPTDGRAELFSFIIDDCKIALPREEFDKAMNAGAEKREFQEMAIAEIMFRSKNSDEDSLTAAARLKIMRPCITAENDKELRKCVRDSIEHFAERLKIAMQQEGGDTKARRNMLDKLPEMEKTIIFEIKEIRAH